MMSQMSRRSSIVTRSVRTRTGPQMDAINGQITTIPTILRRKRSARIRQLEETPVSSMESQRLCRKRKCPLPKSLQSDDQTDEIEIITLQDSSEDDVKRVDRKSSKGNTCAKTSNSVKTKSKPQNLSKHFKSLSLNLLTPNTHPHHSSRCSPLPNFSWADAREVWDLMLNKDETYERNALLLHRHPSLQARMRSILMDWLSEVCEVYRLNRDTYYLCIDFIDRYLSLQLDIPKQQLQLLGITCLFIAAKIEEIYPPKMSEFAYVTDGACNEPEITTKELVILKALNWDLCPMTANNWLTVFMQLYASHEKENSVQRRDGDSFLIPEYQSNLFAQIAHLVDLCVLDIGSLAYSYSIIAASALYHFTNEDIVYQCTGIQMSELRECIIWMIPFALAIKDEGFDNPKLQQKLSEESTQNYHNIQSHTVDLQLLEKAYIKQSQQQVSDYVDSEDTQSPISSPVVTKSTTILTPPKSSSKHS